MTISVLVDANVLIDLVSAKAEAAHRAWSARMLLDATEAGLIVVSVVVWAEVTQYDRADSRLRVLLSPFPVKQEPLPFSAAFPAGQAHSLYRRRGGKRERTLPDFLIGAHALVNGHRLLTRDVSRYRGYFPDLDIISPETHP